MPNQAGHYVVCVTPMEFGNAPHGVAFTTPLHGNRVNNKEEKNMDEKEIQTVEYGRGEDNNLPDPLEVNEDGD